MDTIFGEVDAVAAGEANGSLKADPNENDHHLHERKSSTKVETADEKA
jgi:flavin reductase (DIM6/NTAB) family NADH-FMN oxidoreductase RutF